MLPRQLHPHGPADGARQQQRVRGHVVGAIATIAARGLQADHLDLGFGPLDEECEVGAQEMRILRAGPYFDRPVAEIGNRAGRTDGAVHLVGPGIGSLHRLCGSSDGGVNIALVDQGPRLARDCAQRCFDVLQIGQRRRRLPVELEPCRGLDCILFPLGNNTYEIADADHRNDSRDAPHRIFVDRDQAGADKRPRIDPGIGRAHHAAMQHAGHADVVHIDQLAGRLCGKIDARHRLSDDGIAGGLLQRHVLRKRKANGFVPDQFAIGDAAIVVAAHQPVLDRKLIRIDLELLGGTRYKELPGLCRGLAQGNGCDLDGFACDRCALIGNLCRIAEHDHDTRKGHVELFGDDLPERRANPGAEIDVAVVGRDSAVGRDLDEGLEVACLAGGADNG